ncbi:MAG: hypothetical protein IJH59_03795, partial [Firmicutes bacterium]|nr:hypothetical protein [Bacillota bacterium]
IGIAIMAVGSTGNSAPGIPVAYFAGPFVIIIGFIISWLSAIMIFAIGSAVDDIQTIKELQLNLNNKEKVY